LELETKSSLKSKELTPKQIYRREYYLRNKERELGLCKKWASENAERVKTFRDKYKEENKEYSRQWCREYMAKKRKENPDYCKIQYRKNIVKVKEYSRRRAVQNKRLVMDAYGKVCACCGEEMIEFLAIDHIHSDGNVHRKELGNMVGSPFYRYLIKNDFPFKDRLQVLCYNCNGAKAYYGQCPHKR
jgi:hypothetical protein